MLIQDEKLSYLHLLLWITIFTFTSLPSINAQNVTQARGTDQSVVYEQLKNFGPWDDRNYEITSSDLEFLAPNEAELRDPIPAFFRIIMRKNSPKMRRGGPGQYPRSALQIFRQNYTGYLVNNQYYNKLKVSNNQFEVIMSDGEFVEEQKNKITDKDQIPFFASIKRFMLSS